MGGNTNSRRGCAGENRGGRQPAELASEPEAAERFDLLMLRLRLAMVNEEPALIHDLQSDEWRQDVTAPMLEPVRKKLRLLVQFIEKTRRAPVYTDFADELGPEAYVDLTGFVGAGEFERFREKARALLRRHQNHSAVRKLRTNAKLTAADLADLEALLSGSGGSNEYIEKAKTEANGLGLFVRSLIGLDREAAKQALAGFLGDKTLTGNQIEFVNLIVEHLTARGVVDAGLLSESPFTDKAP